jgi:hypothetical protein
MDKNGRLIIVSRSVDGDMNWPNAGIDLDLEREYDAEIIDIARVWKDHAGVANLTSLENMLRQLRIPYTRLHRAVNDANYTLQVILDRGFCA